MSKQSFKVTIISIDRDWLIRSIKTIREITGLGLADAKAIVENVPTIFMEGMYEKQALKLKKILEQSRIGAIIEIDEKNKPTRKKLRKLSFDQSRLKTFYNNLKEKFRKLSK